MMMQLLLLLLALNVVADANPKHRILISDLRAEWLVNKDGQWLRYDSSSADVRAIYVSLPDGKYTGNQIEVFSPRAYSVWVNGKLVTQADNDTLRFSIDSLRRRYAAPLTVGVFSERGVEHVKVNVVAFSTSVPSADEQPRKDAAFRNFSILAVLILAIFFVMMVQFNSRVTLDYFNMPRLFTLQERDETPVTGRITSRFSFLVYIFIAMWMALVMLIIFQYTKPNWVIISDFLIGTVGEGFLKWSKLTGALLVIFFLKAIIAFVLSAIYRFREAAALQVLNFFRLLSFLLIVISASLLFYFVFGTSGAGWYEGLITLAVWVFGMWAVLVFLKLMSKVSFSVFHLFSYLCASEFFPIIIIFQVLFF